MEVNDAIQNIKQRQNNRARADKVVETCVISQYGLVKDGIHPKIKSVLEITRNTGISRQLLHKYVKRYEELGEERLLPQKRGQKLHTIRKYAQDIKERVIALRRQGYNRYDIVDILKSSGKQTPSISWINKKLEESGLNKMTDEIHKARTRIIKERVGELGHVDSHYLHRGIINIMQ